MECKKHCPCYERILKAQREAAQKTNENYTTEQRKKAGKKAWENRITN